MSLDTVAINMQDYITKMSFLLEVPQSLGEIVKRKRNEKKSNGWSVNAVKSVTTHSAIITLRIKMDDSEACGFKINKEYANKYNKWREREELQKLKDKYGDEADSDESSSEEEDDDADALTPQLEKDWLRTLSALKSKDPRIYEQDAKFYHSESSNGSADMGEKKKKKDKPMYIHDYERKIMLEKGGIVSDEDSDDEGNQIERSPGYYEEQENIKKSFLDAVDDSDSEDDDFLKKRNKSKEDQKKEEEEYREWLKGQKEDLVSEDTQVGEDLSQLREYWTDPKLDEGEKFLRDYILNKKYLDEDDSRIPTYEEIVNEENISEEEDQLEKEEQFERKYNFRYEEPDQEFIKSYPRTMGESVRKKDDKRVKKRQEIKERKQRAKEEKTLELKQLKNLKKKEIMSKLDQIRDITGNQDIGFSKSELDEDFDPKKYDQLMKKMFNDNYYDDDPDEEKPVFPDDEELELGEENWDVWAGPSAEGEEGWEDDEEYAPHCEDADFNMDADYDPNEDRSYGLDPTQKKKKKKSKFAKVLEKKKPVFNPEDKTFEEYFEEYYKLDYEDIIGDMPVRFKYRNVVSNDFGLSTEEVLSCKDKELNQWASLKKTCQYRTEEEEIFDVRIFNKKGRNAQKKLNVLASLHEPEPGTSKVETSTQQSKGIKTKNGKKKKISNPDIGLANTGKPVNKKKRTLSEGSAGTKSPETKKTKLEDDVQTKLPQKKKKKDKPEESSEAPDLTHGQSPKKVENAKKKQTNKKKKKKGKQKPIISDDRLKAYGINPKAFKFKHLPNLQKNS